MSLLTALMAPSNNVCDRLGIEDENERGMMRMLVNVIICAGIMSVAMWAVWKGMG